jgi:hypothetical protein
MKIATLLCAAVFVAVLPQSISCAEGLGTTWVSVPRATLKIVIGKDGGRVTGPGWEHRFEATANRLDFEIAPGLRFVLRRSGDGWVGEYFHPRIRPGNHTSEVHKMTFACGSGECSEGQ